MFFIRHPKPVVDGRAVAVLVVQQKITREPVQHVLVQAPACTSRISCLQAPVVDSLNVDQAYAD